MPTARYETAHGSRWYANVNIGDEQRKKRGFQTRRQAEAWERAGIGHFRFHDLRHTYSSWLLPSVPSHYLMAQLGHSTITTTIDTYGHLTKEAHDSYGEWAEETLSFLR